MYTCYILAVGRSTLYTRIIELRLAEDQLKRGVIMTSEEKFELFQLILSAIWEVTKIAVYVVCILPLKIAFWGLVYFINIVVTFCK